MKGSGFSRNAQVLWNGVPLETNYKFSAYEFDALVPESNIYVGTNQITVENPAPGGGISNSITVNVVNPRVFQFTISPTHVLCTNSSGFTLTVTSTDGTTFPWIPQQPPPKILIPLIQWNGVNLTTTYIDEYHLSTYIPASYIKPVISSPLHINLDATPRWRPIKLTTTLD